MFRSVLIHLLLNFLIGLPKKKDSTYFLLRILMECMCSYHSSHVQEMICHCLYLMSDKKIAPKAANDVKLINGGKILENSKTVGQCRTPFGELSNTVLTMHVVVQPTLAKAKSGISIFLMKFFV